MNKKYGVWGLGVVGKSVLTFLHAHSKRFALAELSVMDKRQPTHEEAAWLQKLNIQYINQNDKDLFFSKNDVIIPSPGINVSDAQSYKHKLQEEIDLFFDAWHKPIIAVTGTVGKTSVVHLLDRILQHNGLKLATGGNIGTGMLDLLSQKADHALLELSSFQLERAERFAPEIAIITNLYANHLDRHGTMKEYLLAKYRIMMHQKSNQKALVPLALMDELRPLTDRPLYYFSDVSLKKNDFSKLKPGEIVYYLTDHTVYKASVESENGTKVYDLNNTPAISYAQNWLIIIAVCDMLGILHAHFVLPSLDLPHHRLEKVAIIGGVTFYNDSKSTIPQSTGAAVDHLLATPGKIHLFLGGLSKGFDRCVSIAGLKDKVSTITCFGAEADLLFNACKQAHIPAQKFATLDEAFKGCVQQAQHGDKILFSPAGSSYDLFKIYTERGEYFVKLVHNYSKSGRVYEYDLVNSSN